MSFLRLALVVLVLAASCRSSGPLDGSSATRASPPPAPQPLDPILGAPLVLRGRTVPWQELRQVVCEGHAGAAAIERARLRIFVADERRRREEQGLAVPTLPAEPEAALRALFLPADPDEFPPATLDAVLGEPGGEAVLDHYRDSFALGRGHEPGPAELQFDARVLQQIAEHLEETAEIEVRPSPGALQRVNGTEILARDIWDEVASEVSETDVREAKLWLAKTTLLRDALERAGAWLSDAEADEAYHEHSDPYVDSVFSQERIALVVKRFPSVSRYREYRRLWESFRRWKEPDMTAEALAKQADFRTKALVGQVTVDADVLLCSAFDFATGRWKEDGWNEAERRMREVVARLDGGASWDELMESCSDFPREPATDANDEPGPSGGRFRRLQRNNLMLLLGESEYSLFLEGHSLSDGIVFEQEVGTRGEPVRGPLGWYLPRLLRRSGPPRGIDDDLVQQLVVEDYVCWYLNAYGEELARGLVP